MAERKHPEAKCEVCPLYEKGKYVAPDFNHNETADYLFVGEAPGATEAKVGKPFVGVSGKLLDMLLKEYGIGRSDTVLTNACLCRPKGNATPTAEAIEACHPALEDVIEKAQPKFVIPMGVTATSSVLGKKNVKIMQERVGPPKEVGKTYKVVPTVHPAACLRNPNLFPNLDADISKLKNSLTVTFEPPRYKEFTSVTQARLAVGQLLQRTRADTVVLDLEVGEDKDIDFGHPETILCAGIGYEPGKVIVIGRDAFKSNAFRQDFASLLRAKKVVCHNAKYDLGTLYRMGFGTLEAGGDTMLMHYTTSETGLHGLKYLAKELLGAPDWDAELTQYPTWADIPPDILHKYNAYDVGTTWDLMEMFDKQMDSDDHRLHKFLCRASDQIMLMESEGIFIDRPALDELQLQLSEELELAKTNIQFIIHETGVLDHMDDRIKRLILKNNGFNPNSTDQVKAVLEALTGSKLYSTDADHLEILTKHRKPVVRDVATAMLEWRKKGKLYGTYVKGTLKRLGDDGRLRTSFLLHRTETGRLSSRNPNVQNVPRGETIRRIYAAEPGHKIVYGDYSNVEGRIVSILAQCKQMIEDHNSGEKIHNVIARAVYGDNFDKEQYTSAKSVVHGVNYARTPHGISEGEGIPLALANKTYNYYKRRYPEVFKWHASIKKAVLEDGETLMTPWGRKRRFHLITKENREDVYKEALAFKPQSIGSDICLEAGIELRKMGLPIRILIHDGIVAEPAEEDVEEVSNIMREVMMRSARSFTEEIPFPVDIEVGDNWGQVG